MILRRQCNGAKYSTEATEDIDFNGLVGERCGHVEAIPVRGGGESRRENVGMSNEKHVGIMLAENLRVPTEGSSASGKSDLSRGRKS